MNAKKIVVIGGGVSGVTTALTLQLLGYETEIYTTKIADQITDKTEHPEFASLFPSASVIPHSVYSNQLQNLFELSQALFYELRKQAFPGLTIRKHFEVFESDPGQPGYCSWMPDFQPIETINPNEVPHRFESQDLYGWSFNCIFADWPLYFPALTNLYRQSGGNIIRRTLTSGDVASLPAQTVINCSGIGSPDLFNDPVDEQLVLRGHLLHKPGAPLITDSGDEIISYNYTPKASVYAGASGAACDVYCYPRKDGWVLGGSRQAGCLTDTGEWDGDLMEGPSYEIDGIRFPAQIIDLNSKILERTYGYSLSHSEELSASVGYRYIRSRGSDLRLDRETIADKTVYHNYGHGGAGVTLSWGCALTLASRITSQESTSLKSALLYEIENTE